MPPTLHAKLAWRARDRRYLWHPYSRHSEIMARDFPIIVRGAGCHLFDTGGRRYFDAISSWWCCNLGHGRHKIIRAIQKQAEILQHSILGNLSHPWAIQLAEMLIKTMPGKSWRIFFGSDGASAVEAALKIALQYWHNIGQPERRQFISLAGAYHGDTLGAVAVGYQPQFHRPFRSILPRSLQAPAPCCAECAWSKTPDNCRFECFQPMAKLLEKHHRQTAAVIVEPLCQGAAGMRIYHPGYLTKLAEVCRHHKILLIVDEIAMGMGRTGRMWAFEHAGITPDIVCIGKGLSAGYLPISAAAVRAYIYETFQDTPADRTFYHGHTFAGNPIACAAAIATLEFYRVNHVLRHVQAGARLLAKHFTKIKTLPQVKNVRTLGMIAAAALADVDGQGTSRAQFVRDLLLKQGMLVRPLGNVIYLMPPLLTPLPLLKKIVAQFGAAIEQAPRIAARR